MPTIVLNIRFQRILGALGPDPVDFGHNAFGCEAEGWKRLSVIIGTGRVVGERGIRPGIRSNRKDRKTFYNKDLVWLCWEATANVSRKANSLIPGKIQGILPKLGRMVRLETSIHKGLAAKFPKGGTGNLKTRTANFF